MPPQGRIFDSPTAQPGFRIVTPHVLSPFCHPPLRADNFACLQFVIYLAIQREIIDASIKMYVVSIFRKTAEARFLLKEVFSVLLQTIFCGLTPPQAFTSKAQNINLSHLSYLGRQSTHLKTNEKNPQ